MPVHPAPAKASRGQSIPKGCENWEANKNMKVQKPCIVFVHSEGLFSYVFESLLFRNNFQSIL